MDKKKLSNVKTSDIYKLDDGEITTINNCLIGAILTERYSKFFFEWYWKKKFFILTETHFITKSRHYSFKRSYKLKNLKINGIMCEDNLIYFTIYNKKTNKKIMSVTSINYKGLLVLHKEITKNVNFFK